MTADEVVSYLLEGEGRDFLRESLAWVCQLPGAARRSEQALVWVVQGANVAGASTRKIDGTRLRLPRLRDNQVWPISPMRPPLPPDRTCGQTRSRLGDGFVLSTHSHSAGVTRRALDLLRRRVECNQRDFVDRQK